MRYRLLGNSGLRVSEVFLGAMTFGEDWGWGSSEEECRRIFTAYAEAGGNVIDTANSYTDGASERIVGSLLSTDRDRFVVSTKYTVTLDGADPNAGGNHRKSLIRSVEQSLRRLGTDYIDVLWVHIWDRHTPIEETMRALDDTVRAGKVLYVGISDAPAWLIARANTMADFRGWSPFVAIQAPYSLITRDIERELLPMASELGLSVAAWSPLEGGALSGKYTRPGADVTTRLNDDDIPERHRAIARQVDAVADDLGLTSAQVAIAWIRAHHPGMHPILGARSLPQFAENLDGLDIELPRQQVEMLDDASAIQVGFPGDFLEAMNDIVYGPSHHGVDGRA